MLNCVGHFYIHILDWPSVVGVAMDVLANIHYILFCSPRFHEQPTVVAEVGRRNNTMALPVVSGFLYFEGFVHNCGRGRP